MLTLVLCVVVATLFLRGIPSSRYTSNAVHPATKNNGIRSTFSGRLCPIAITVPALTHSVISLISTSEIHDRHAAFNTRTQSPPRIYKRSVSVRQWTYNFGVRQFMRQLRFENGILKDIETLKYGY